VLVKFKPTILPRMIVAVILGVVLIYCLINPHTGDLEHIKNIHSVGWLSLGLLFGIGRGEFVIEWLVQKFFGAPNAESEQLAAEVLSMVEQSPGALPTGDGAAGEAAADEKSDSEKSGEETTKS